MANSIIKKVVAKRNDNNAQKKLEYFQFNAYNKIVVSANPDSIQGKIDSLFIESEFGKGLYKIDSSELVLLNIVQLILFNFYKFYQFVLLYNYFL